MVYANDFIRSSDSETLNAAILARGADGIVIIEPRTARSEPERRHWLLDEAILLPSDVTVILRNCTLKLSDKCRDNFFRSANCGLGIEENEPLSNIHIKGEGRVVFEGADHPRASGDGSKVIKRPCPYEVADICKYADWVPEERKTPEQITHSDRHSCSYGTDAGNENESQKGDWRGIGILFAMVDHFSISGITIRESHGWGISLEACSEGYIERICFDARMSKMIDGMLQNMENQDGIDLRNGCHDISISDISGETGDDVVALTAIKSKVYRKGGSLCSTQVMHNDWTRRDPDIYNVIIRNVRAYSSLCFIVRLLPCESQIRNVVIDGIIDTSPDGSSFGGGILLGEWDGNYGKNLPGGLKNITISNVLTRNSKESITVVGYLEDSAISNVVSTNKEQSPILLRRKGALKNVSITNVVAKEGVEPVEHRY